MYPYIFVFKQFQFGGIISRGYFTILLGSADRLLSRTSVAMLTCRYGNARAHTCKVHTSLRTPSLRRIFPVCSLTVFL